jgi:iron complex outermembrane receptor protein
LFFVRSDPLGTIGGEKDMTSRQRVVCSVAVGSLMWIGGGEVVLAEEAPQRYIEEIVVTAEKRESNVQDTPIAISAFNAETMDDIGIGGAADIANYTPGMTYNASPNRIFLRGIGRVENSLGSEPGVAIYRDGIYTNEAASVSDNTFFAERIEVLRGPQGTLYGRNAIGGAANVVSKKPTDEFKGEVRLGAYNYGGQYIGLSASGPITDRVRYRLAAETTSDDGWIENIAGGDQNNQDFTRIEGQLDIDLTETLNIWMVYQDYEWDTNQTGGVMISPYNTTSPTGPVIDFSTDFQQLVPNAQLGYDVANPAVRDIHKVNRNEAGYIKNPGALFTSHVTWDLENWQVKYIFGMNDYDWDYLLDYDATGRTDIQYLNFIAQYEEYQQHEVQLISQLGGKFEFIFGAFYYHNENAQPWDLYSPTNPVLKTPVWADYAGTVCFCVVDSPANPQGIFYHQLGELETDSYAGYAQMDIFPNDMWHVSLGLRYSKDEKDAYEEQRIIFDGQGSYAWYANFIGMSWYNVNTPTPGPQARIAWDFNNGTVSSNHSDEWTSTTWALGVDYKPDDNSLYYAKVSTGYKAGGFRLGSLEANPGVDEETVLAYEAGAKNTFNNVIQVNTAVYYYLYEDMQVPVSAIINGVNNLLFRNAKEANQFGIEVDGQWAATDNLMLYATYSYMNTEIDTMGYDVTDETEINPVASDLSGNELIKAPPHKFTFNGHYTWDITAGEIGFVATYIYTDDQWSDIFNREDTVAPAFERVDFRLTYRNPANTLRVSGYVRNAFDEEIFESKTRSGWYFNHQVSASIQPPRTYGVELNYEF